MNTRPNAKCDGVCPMGGASSFARRAAIKRLLIFYGALPLLGLALLLVSQPPPPLPLPQRSRVGNVAPVDETKLPANIEHNNEERDFWDSPLMRLHDHERNRLREEIIRQGMFGMLTSDQVRERLEALDLQLRRERQERHYESTNRMNQPKK